MTRKLLLLTNDETLIETFQSLDGFDVHVSRENWYVEPNQWFDVVIADLDWVRWNGSIVAALKLSNAAFGIASLEKLPLSKSTIESFHDIWVKPLHTQLLPHRIEKGIEYQILSNSKSEFAKYVPHQISQNAARIVGYSDFMKSGYSGELSDQHTAFANIIFNSAKQIQRLLAMFRDVIPIATKTPFEPRAVGVLEVMSELDYRRQKENVLLDISDDLPLVFTDLNCIVNALRLLFIYALAVNSHNDNVTLSVAHDQETQGVKFIIRGIQDNPQENSLEEYLENLYLGESYKEDDRKSLASARAIVYKIGSWLKMKKEEDKSLTFYFTLPIAKDTDP